jgi:NCAIR mutase (PurE)-related protein
MDHDSLNLDFARAQRCGFPEVVYAAGKTVDEVVAACQRLYDAHQLVLLTRCRPEQIAALSAAFPDGEVFERCGSFLRGAPTPTHDGVVVISAGTSDEGVAEEAVATLCARGVAYQHLADCGVAGLHRLLTHGDTLAQAKVIIAVAGFEAALTSVVAGLVACPVIGCPTSVGYGACEDGRTALNAMLVCCASGVTVVNIDNGFGAGFAAASMAKLAPSMAGRLV